MPLSRRIWTLVLLLLLAAPPALAQDDAPPLLPYNTATLLLPDDGPVRLAVDATVGDVLAFTLASAEANALPPTLTLTGADGAVVGTSEGRGALVIRVAADGPLLLDAEAPSAPFSLRLVRLAEDSDLLDADGPATQERALPAQGVAAFYVASAGTLALQTTTEGRVLAQGYGRDGALALTARAEALGTLALTLSEADLPFTLRLGSERDTRVSIRFTPATTTTAADATMPPAQDAASTTPAPPEDAASTSDAAADAAPCTVRPAVTGGVNVRSGPGTEFSVIAFLTVGNTLRAVGVNGAWFQVALPESGAGWVADAVVDVSGAACNTLPTLAPSEVAPGIATAAPPAPDATATPGLDQGAPPDRAREPYRVSAGGGATASVSDAVSVPGDAEDTIAWRATTFGPNVQARLTMTCAPDEARIRFTSRVANDLLGTAYRCGSSFVVPVPDSGRASGTITVRALAEGARTAWTVTLTVEALPPAPTPTPTPTPEAAT